MAEYIDKQAFLNYMRGTNRYFTVKCDIKSFPTADVAPVVYGRWIPVQESEMTGWQPELAGRDPICGYVCSVCKEEATFDCNDEFVLSNYCPNCGAKMDSEDRGGRAE